MPVVRQRADTGCGGAALPRAIAKSLASLVLLAIALWPSLQASAQAPPTAPPSPPQPLTRIADIKALSPALAAKSLPLKIEAVVTFYQPHEEMLYVQDPTGAIYVYVSARHSANIHQGSRVVITGNTAASYRNLVWARHIQSIGESPLPAPKPATFYDLINGKLDCDLVRATGVVRSATIQRTQSTPFLLLEILLDGGPVRVQVLHFGNIDPNTFLDSRITFTAAAGKIFDGKFEPVGVKLYVDNISAIQVLSRPKVSPVALPLSPFDRVSETYGADNNGQRIRVRGSVTLYDPGELLVLDQAGKTLLVHTHQDDPLQLGQIVDAVGFPDFRDYGPSLVYGEFIPTAETHDVVPRPISYNDAMTGKYGYNLVSLTGTLIAEVNEARQDSLILKSGDHIFSAVYRSAEHLPALHIGSAVRVTGVCIIDSYGPYNMPVQFSIRLRSPADVTILAAPPWMTVGRLASVIGLLLGVVVAALVWAWQLRRRVAVQTAVISRAAEEDAAWERRTVYLEKERSHVLEAINSSQPLDSVLELIAAFIGKQIWGVKCSFRLFAATARKGVSAQEAVTSGSGNPPTLLTGTLNIRTIKSGDGIVVGEMLLVTESEWHSSAHSEEILDIGGRLAALAIDNRMLHSQLVYRSEYDQLTDVPNRFLIEGRLERALVEAAGSGGRVAVIYVDLDEFKQVNDIYGHRVGDVYLQQAAHRLAAQLRDRDVIARIGGDEFLAIIHNVSGREEAEGVVGRLNGCFRHPFAIEEFTISGTASIGLAVYPEDGENGEELKRTADHAMYLLKRRSKLAAVATVS